MSARTNRFQRLGRILPGMKRMAAAVLTFLGIGFAVGFLTGAPFIAGILGGLDQFLGWLVLVAVVAYFGYYTDDINVGFVFTFIALLALLSMVLPGWATQPFSFISELLFGTPDLGIDPVEFAVLSVSGVIAYWAVRTRLFGRGKRPAAVANTVRTNAQSLVRQYAKILGAIGGFAVTSVFLFGNQLGEVLGEVFTLAANSPMVGSYLAGIAGYFGAFFTGLPFISAFGPQEVFVVLVVLFLVAAGAKYSSAID